jgi:hypothetical protein
LESEHPPPSRKKRTIARMERNHDHTHPDPQSRFSPHGGEPRTQARPRIDLGGQDRRNRTARRRPAAPRGTCGCTGPPASTVSDERIFTTTTRCSTVPARRRDSERFPGLGTGLEAYIAMARGEPSGSQAAPWRYEVFDTNYPYLVPNWRKGRIPIWLPPSRNRRVCGGAGLGIRRAGADRPLTFLQLAKTSARASTLSG